MALQHRCFLAFWQLVLLILPVIATAAAQDAASPDDQSSGFNLSSDYGGLDPDYWDADYGDSGDVESSTSTKSASGALANFTQALLRQHVSIFGQGMRIPDERFASHPCQVVYMANPDWATLQLQVTFTHGPDGTCAPGTGPQAAFAYLDGYNGPQAFSGVTLTSGEAAWVAAVTRTDPSDGARGAPAVVQPPPASQSASAGSSPASSAMSRAARRSRRRLVDFKIPGVNVQFETGRETFKSAFDSVRGGAKAAEALLSEMETLVPGPRGPLTVPALLSVRLGSSVAAASGYTKGVLVQLDEQREAGSTDPLSNTELMSDVATSYWASEDDCRAVLADSSSSFSSGLTTITTSSSSSSSSDAGSSRTTTTLTLNTRGTSTQDSCFATQLVVLLYNPCVQTTAKTGVSASGVTSTPEAMAGVTANNSSDSSSTSARRQRVVSMLEAALDSQATNMSMARGQGFAQVLVTYTPYDKCVRKGVDRLYDVSIQVMIFTALLFGWLVLLLLLPSLYRLFLEFPFTLLVHGIRKLQGKDDALKPMRPGLHSHKHRRLPLPLALAAVTDPLLRLRKHLLYAVITVHYSDGQSRWLQVAVISTVALSIAQAVYTPGISPPLEHFVPPLALQITRTGSAVAALEYFFDIVVFSSFMGTLGYLSMLANYNSPVNRYYRVQVLLSGFFMALQDVLVLLQLISLLAEWRFLRPSWPYLPMVVFQLINLTGANVMQAIIFSKRHDQHNRAMYDAYMKQKAARADETLKAATEARARTRKPSSSGAGGDGSLGRRRLLASGGAAADGSSSSSSASTANERAVVAELIDADGDGRGGDFFDDVRRSRAQSGSQVMPQQQQRRRRRRLQLEIATGEDGAEEEGHLQPQQRRQSRAAHSGPRRKSRRRAMPQNDCKGEAEEGYTEEGVGDEGSVPLVKAVSVSEDVRTVLEAVPPPPQRHGHWRRAGRPCRVTEDAEDGELQNDNARDAAASPAATSRPRRRLLADESLGPGPVAEAVENSGSDGSIAGGSSFERRLTRRRGGHSGGGGVPPAIELTAHAVSGDAGRGRRLLGSHGLPYGNPSHRSGNQGQAAVSGLGGGGASGTDRNGSTLPTIATTASAAIAADAAAASDCGGGHRRAFSLPRLSKAPALPSLKVWGSMPRTTTGSELLNDKDVLARLRDAAAAAAAFGQDSDGLGSDHGASGRGGSSSNSSDDEERATGSGGKRRGPGGVRGVVLKATRPLRRLWRGLREGDDFRYPAWLLAALLVSGYMVIFHFGKALAWSSNLTVCLQDPAPCVTNLLGKYIKFVSRFLSTARQQQVRDTLDTWLASKDDLLAGLAGMLGVNVSSAGGPNATATITASPLVVLDKQSLLEQANSEGNIEAMQALISAAVTELLSGLDPDMAASLASNFTAKASATLVNSIVASLVDSTNARLASTGRQQVAVYRRLNSTINVLFNAANTTSRYVTKAVEVQGEIRVWQANLSARFRWTSGLGFTLGLLLGLSTLLQTAASFRRAIRQARRMRVARRLFKALFAAMDGDKKAGKDGTKAVEQRTAAAAAAGKGVLMGGEESLLANRAREAKISFVVFFFGVLMSTAVIQLYMVGVLLSVVLAVLTHPWTWQFVFPKTWLYLVAIAAVIVLNKFVLIGYVGNAFLSDGDHIYRPAAWLAFIFIMSITNLVIGLLLAVYRIVLLLLTTVLALGKLEVTIFTFFADLDLPHQSFLAGVHMHESMSNFHDPIYLPGPRGRAHRRWRKLRETVRRLSPEELRLLATLGRPREVQDCLDHVVVDMNAARDLAAASRSSGVAEGRNRGGGGGGSRRRSGGSGLGRSRFADTGSSAKSPPQPVAESRALHASRDVSVVAGMTVDNGGGSARSNSNSKSKSSSSEQFMNGRAVPGSRAGGHRGASGRGSVFAVERHVWHGSMLSWEAEPSEEARGEEREGGGSAGRGGLEVGVGRRRLGSLRM